MNAKLTCDRLTNFENLLNNSMPPTRFLTDSELLGLALDRICQKWEIVVERPPEIILPGYTLSEILGYAGENLIRMREDLGNFSPEHLSTWVHEIAHEFLHYQKNGALAPVTIHTHWAVEQYKLGDLADNDFGPSWLMGSVLNNATNRIGYPVSNATEWECEAESVAKCFFERIHMPWAKLAPYRTVEGDRMTDAQRAVLRTLYAEFRQIKREGLVAPTYVWNVVPAHPRYSYFDELHGGQKVEEDAFLSFDKWLSEKLEDEQRERANKTSQIVENNEDVLPIKKCSEAVE